MTAEQENQVAYIGEFQKLRSELGNVSIASQNIETLLSIIDDLKKQQPKRYTEAELMNWHIEWMQRTPLQGQGRHEFMIDFARFLGMIKTEGES